MKSCSASALSWGQCYFWATHPARSSTCCSWDGRRRLGFEFKRTTAPTVTASMRAALTDLRLTHLDVIHAGDTTFPLARNIRAVSARMLLDAL